MRLHRLVLRDWRRYRGQDHELLFDDRGTVLTGPNESGKSTLFEAVRRALFDRSRTQAKWVEGLVPYGSKGALPEVTLEFTHGGHRLEIRKAFGHRGHAELLERVDRSDGASDGGGEWRTLARNEEAEEELFARLGARASNRRDGSRPDTWGVFQWLFVPQDLRELPPGRTDTVGQLGAAGPLGLEPAGVSPEFDGVRRLVLEEYGRIFTPTGKLSSRAELHCLEEERTHLETERERWAAEVAAIEERRRRYEGLVEGLPRLEREAEEAGREWDRVQEEVVDLSGAGGRRKAAEARRDQDRAQAQRATAVSAERRRRAEEVERTRSAYDEASRVHQQTQILHSQVRAGLEEVRGRIAVLEGRVVEVRRRRDTAADRLRTREVAQQIEDLSGRLARAAGLDRQILEARAALRGPTPGADLLRRIEGLLGESRARRWSVEKAALRVTVEGAPELKIRLDGRPLEDPKVAGRPIALREVRVETPNGVVRIEGTLPEAERLAEEAAECDAEIGRLLEPFGVTDLERLRELRERRIRLEEKTAALADQRRAVDERFSVEIEEELAKRREELAALEARHPPENDPDSLEEGNATGRPAPEATEDQLRARVEQLSTELEAVESELKERRTRRNRLSEELLRAEKDAREAENAYQVARTRHEGALEELDRHRDEHGSAEKCAAFELEAKKRLAASEGELTEAQKALERLENDATGRRQTAKRRADAMHALWQAELVRVEELRNALEREAAEGAYSRLAEVERQLEVAEDRRVHLWRRAEAVKLLSETIDAVRTRAVRRVVLPIKQDLEELLETTTHGRYSIALLDDELEPLRLEGDRTCRLEDGSQGLRELVATLIRLSVAAHLAQTEPQTLVLDDPCVHVSHERTARLVERLNALTEAGRVQVVVLTHRPGEFAGLAGEIVEVDRLRAARRESVT